jgi:hypothetical protein
MSEATCKRCDGKREWREGMGFGLYWCPTCFAWGNGNDTWGRVTDESPPRVQSEIEPTFPFDSSGYLQGLIDGAEAEIETLRAEVERWHQRCVRTEEALQAADRKIGELSMQIVELQKAVQFWKASDEAKFKALCEAVDRADDMRRNKP